MAALPIYFGERIRAQIAQAGPPDTDSWITIEVAFALLEVARNRILAFGRGVELLKPLALRKSVLDFATQIVALYQDQMIDSPTTKI